MSMVEESDVAEDLYVTAMDDGNEVVASLYGEERSPSRRIRDVDRRAWTDETIEPPADPVTWAAMLQINGRLWACINTLARNSCGLGYRAEPIEEMTEDTAPEERAAVEDELARIHELFDSPNDDMPTSELFYLLKVDEEATGNAYLEVTRRGDGWPDGLNHLPSVSMRILKGGVGFVQKRARQSRYFKCFGDDRVIDARTGEPVASEDGLAIEHRASEIIHFRLYSPLYDWYGVPRFVPLARGISGCRKAEIRNEAFFDNDGVGRIAICVSGGKLTDKAVDTIVKFSDAKMRGPHNAHRVMVLQANPRKVGLGGEESRTDVKVVPLTIGVTDDHSHAGYIKSVSERIRELFNIARIFLSGEDVTHANAYVSRQLTNDQVFEPDRRVKEHRIKSTIIRALGCTRTRFRFQRPTTADPMDIAKAADIYGRLGGVTPNDARRLSGQDLPALAEDWADKPMQLTLAELRKAPAPAPAAAPAEPTDPEADRERRREELVELLLDVRAGLLANHV